MPAAKILKARDTFAFWLCLAWQCPDMNSEVYVPLKGKWISLDELEQGETSFGLDSIKEMLGWMMEFPNWCDSNKEKLANIKEFNVYSMGFTSLPKEVICLVNLEALQLDNKYLTELPVELLQLAKLKAMYSISEGLFGRLADFDMGK